MSKSVLAQICFVMVAVLCVTLAGSIPSAAMQFAQQQTSVQAGAQTSGQATVQAGTQVSNQPLTAQQLQVQQAQIRARQSLTGRNHAVQADPQRDLPGAGATPVPVEALKHVEGAQRVFGDQIFNGRFSAQSFVGFNPDYQIAVGDLINLRLWGGFNFDGGLIVDAQGNIFLPSVGPIKVLGVRNDQLNSFVADAVTRVYKANVGVYASLAGAEPVKIFTTGFVRSPGLYAGHASDSVLYFLDAAGGIDPERGSYLEINILRGGETLHSVNLYDFLLTGKIPLFQLADGDVIVVTPVKGRVRVDGEVASPFVFEFAAPETKVRDVLALARPNPQATHVRINRNTRSETEVEYLPLASAYDVTIYAGDVLEVRSDKNQGTISVRVEGEHESQQEYVLDYGATLGDLLAKVKLGSHAQLDALQLFRESVKTRQRDMLTSQLRALERSVLTARSNTKDEAELRQREAELILQFVDRAENVEPKGQVTLANAETRDDILLEPGDVIHIPRTSNLVMVHGDVLFPSATAYRRGATIRDYIDQAGGFTQSKGSSNILLLRRDGSFERISGGKINSSKVRLNPGDEIFILPKVATKSFQLAKDLITIFYQLALSAGVVLRL